ncbi:MAG: TrbM/KikA/MpfK family conjugal transfer protein [Nitrospira sp.]|nr:TrbM/KikA/MpfK family conjugal transfer protein [Nitrospira sp.]
MTRHWFIISTMALALLGLGTWSAEAESPGVPPPVPALSSGPPAPSITPVPLGMSPNSGAVSLLTGTARDACEALLCLSAIGSAPAECAASLAKYHAVQMFGGGPAFLAACPLVR